MQEYLAGSWDADRHLGLVDRTAAWLLVIALSAAFAVTIGCGSGSGARVAPTPTPTPNPTPSVTTLSPRFATATGLAFNLTVNGSGFLPTSQVEWNGLPRTTTFLSGTQLQAAIMAPDLAAAGNAAVTVVNPTPGGGTSNAATFAVVADTIAFDSGRALNGTDAANNAINVWVMNADGTGQTALTKLMASLASSFQPVMSPDGAKIVFVSTRALDGTDNANTNNTFNIWIMNSDGSGAVPLTKRTAVGSDSFSPIWSPDGSKIAFVSNGALNGSDNANTVANIWVMSPDGTGGAPLTTLTQAACGQPGWSPDGAKIVFQSFRAFDGSDASNPGSTFNIWVMNSDGKAQTPLTRLSSSLFASSGSPSWSPDGTKIAFTSSRALDGTDNANTNRTSNIWIMNADGNGAAPFTRLTTNAASIEFVAWSPDSTKLAYPSARALDGGDSANPTSNVWTSSLSGTDTPLTRLTASGAGMAGFELFWTPDESRIIFTSFRNIDGTDSPNPNTTANIWATNTNGSRATPLTKLQSPGAGSENPSQP